MTRSRSFLRLPLLGSLFLFTSLGLFAPACVTTGAVTCGDGFCPPGTVCAEDNDPPVCVAARGCGNGDIDNTAGEVCDDGNIKDGDGCSSTCTSKEVCGNRITDKEIEVPEECDQGGETSTCNDDCTHAECGDGKLNRTAAEVCDDGNTKAGDGCDTNCKSEECGNGVEEPAFDEECDDGLNCENGDECEEDADCTDGDKQCKPRNDDGCSADCQEELCGNGKRDPGEVCDDGNENNSDDCLVLSKTECIKAECGDGYVHDEGTGTEACDDDGESAMCNADCTTAACGDGKTNRSAGEDCDDDGDSPTCNANCTFARCGDDVTNTAAGETCDDNGDSAACDENCTSAVCGDSYVNRAAGEECDTGGPSSFCNDECQLSECGDGEIDPASGEDCDDDGESATCNLNCTTAMCGDGIVNSSFVLDLEGTTDSRVGEQCDPDTGATSDPQSADENSATCDRDCSSVRCGDNFTNGDAGEECDDVYVTSGGKPHTDECDANCTDAACGDGTVNPAFEVDLLGSSSTLPGEECDPASGMTADEKRATSDAATCDRDCSLPRCGDFYRNTVTEQCDDQFVASGPKPNAATCDSDCTAPACGDGIQNGMFAVDFLSDDAPNSACPSAGGTMCYPEQCDPNTGATSNTKRAAASTEFCDLDCTTARCGDDYINSAAGETCEHTYRGIGTPAPTASCDSDCTLPECGDGLVNSEVNEDCDPGTIENPITTVGDPSVATDDSPTCNRDCTNSECGDGYINTADGEECDDDNTNANDGCNSSCQVVCGDGHPYPPEECDDGDTDDADACKNDCTLP